MPTKLKPSGVDTAAQFSFDSITTSTVVVGNVAISDSGNGNIQVASVAANGEIGAPAAIAGGGGVTVYATAADLPLVSVANGAQAYVSSTNRLYLWTGTGWFNVALINTEPTITTGPDASYTFASDGTPTVLTLIASDPEGIPIVWSYQVTSGSLTNGGGATATVSQSNNIFTITPSTNSTYAGSFSLTFTASDGVNIDTATSSFSLSFGPTGTLAYTIHNPNVNTGSEADFFGYAVDAHSGKIAASATAEDEVGTNKGIVYLFDASNGALIRTFTQSSVTDSFGSSVGLYGNTLVVGTPFAPSTGGALRSGRITVYDVSSNTPLYTIENPNVFGTANTDDFGQEVAVSDLYIAGAACTEDTAAAISTGAVYVFHVANGSLARTIVNPVTSGSFQGTFGRSIALVGDNLYIGDSLAPPSNFGFVYQYSVSTGSLIRTINNPNVDATSNVDYFGHSIAATADYVIVGAYNEDGPDGSGRAYIFHSSNGTLLRTLNNPNAYGTANADTFGKKVSIDGDYCVVSASDEDSASGTAVGAAYIFRVSTGDLVATLTNPVTTAAADSDYFGDSARDSGVVISGSTIAVSSWRAESNTGTVNAGKVYVYN